MASNIEKSKYIFHFKKFKIKHEKSAMKIGIDSVILGAWTNIPSYGSILDVGTGCGILALMLAQRSNNNVMIDAIECDFESYKEAIFNFDNSPWKNRLRAIHGFFQDYAKSCKLKYKLIISNPPYFKNGTNPPSNVRKIARHENLLNIDEFFFYSSLLLDNKGIISIIVPYERYSEIKCLCENYKMSIQRILYIRPTPEKEIHRICLEISNETIDKIDENFLIIEKGGRHNYTEDYINLTKDFYIIF